MGRLKAGTKVERYVVEGALGEGGMARVYRVRHETLGTEKALKVLTLTARDVRKRLVQEGQVQATLAHDNIVKVEDVLQVKDAPALLMEFVDGPTLEAWLTRYQPTLDEALTLFRGICAGVGHAHAKGLIHRDLKPANVLLAVTEDGMIPKVTDFGLAKAVRAEDYVDSGGKTRTGATMGTPQFMAPEQIRDASQVDRRADMWSLGCILYRLACGVPPFEGDDIIELFNVVAAGDFIPPDSLRRDLPERVVVAIDALLQADPTRRLQDCGELLEYLDGEVDTLGERTIVPLGSLRDATAPSTRLDRWLPPDSEAATIARELADETLQHLPKLERHKKGWTTPRPADRTDEKERSRSKREKKRRKPSEEATDPTPAPVAGASTGAQDTVVPVAPPPPRRGTAKRVAMGVVTLGMLGGALLLLLLGGGLAVGLGLVPQVALTDDGPTKPRPVPPPTRPPEPRPVPVNTPDPVPTPTSPRVRPAPEQTPTTDRSPPAPTPQPPAAPPAPAGSPAEVSYTGAKMLWLEPEGGGPAEREREVPAGRYRVMALFEGEAEAVMAGRVTLRDGQRVTIKCVPDFQQCKP